MAPPPADPTNAILFFEIAVKVLAPTIAILIFLSGMISSVKMLKRIADEKGAQAGDSMAGVIKSSQMDRTSSRPSGKRQSRASRFRRGRRRRP